MHDGIGIELPAGIVIQTALLFAHGLQYGFHPGSGGEGEFPGYLSVMGRRVGQLITRSLILRILVNIAHIHRYSF